MPDDFYQHIKRLPTDVRRFFMSEEPRVFCEEACFLYGVDENAFKYVNLPIGDILVGEMPLSDYPSTIAKESGIDLPVAYGIAYEVNRNIFSKFPDRFKDSSTLGSEWESKKSAPVIRPEEAKAKVLERDPWLLEKDGDDTDEPVIATVALTLLQAVSQYPKLGEQQITGERIRISGQQEAVRPNLSNWIKAYRNDLGVGHHDPVIRSKFLFDSENGKRLSSGERERLNLIIRSVEDNVPLSIDVGRMEIVFPAFDDAKDAMARPSAVPMGTMDARSGMPARPSDTGPAIAVPARRVVPVVTRPLVPDPVSIPGNRGPVRPADGRPSASPQVAPPSNLPVSGSAPPAAPRRSMEPVPSIRTSPASSPDSVSDRPAAQASVSPDSPAGTLSFSSNHSLPVEFDSDRNLSIRPAVRRRPMTPLPSATTSSDDASPKRTATPFRIRPVSFDDDPVSDATDPGAVVDLRGK